MTDEIPAIRILPMSEDEFREPVSKRPKTHEEVQSEFFLKELPAREGGRYYFRKSGLKAEQGTVVLFQYDNKIIAKAVFVRQEKFETAEGPYEGAIYFDIDSIRVFDPVGPDLLHVVWPEEFKGFSNVKSQLTPESFPEFEEQLENTRSPDPSLAGLNQSLSDSVDESQQRTEEELHSRIAKTSPTPEQTTVTARVFRRNPDVVAVVLSRADGVCEECKAPAPFIRRSNATPYLEIHHRRRLADGGEDTVENAIAICPNCHRRAHYGPAKE